MRIPRSGRCMRAFSYYSCLVVGLVFGEIGVCAEKSPPPSTVAASSLSALPYEVTPEAVQALSDSRTPFRLVEAGRSASNANLGPAHVRTIYFTALPSFREARNQVVRDRNAGLNSQRLLGTPEDWRRLKLDIDPAVLPSNRAVSLTPRQLSEAIKDAADMDLVDLRPVIASSAAASSSLSQALRLMPHEVEGALSLLSKRRWIVLIDSGSREAIPIADSLIKRGYPLVAVLEGGYPAWTQSTDR